MKKKYIAPIVITILVIVYLCIYFGFLVYTSSLPLSILFGCIGVGIGATMIYVCIQRIKEIRSKEDDDLSQY